MDEGPKHTLTGVNTMANGETEKEMDREYCRGPMDRSTWVNSRTSYKTGKARSCGPTDRNMWVNSRTINQMDKARIRFQVGGCTWAKSKMDFTMGKVPTLPHRVGLNRAYGKAENS